MDKNFDAQSTINVPISFVLDLSGSKLSGKDIGVGDSYSIIKLTDNLYNIEIPPQTLNGSTITKLYGAANYLSLNRPNIENVIQKGGEIKLSTDLPSRIALFYTSRNGPEHSVKLLYRSNVLSNSHTIDLNKNEIRNYQSNNSLTTLLSGDIYRSDY